VTSLTSPCSISAHWSELDLDTCIEHAVAVGLVDPAERCAVRAWIAEVLWEGATADGVCVYAYEHADVDDAYFALLVAWMALSNLTDNHTALDRYDKYGELIATA
jgi:hypothetical protein